MGITREEALDCFRSDDLIGLGMEADAIRRRLHPEGVVTYALDAAIEYPGAAQVAKACMPRICNEIEDAIEDGATSVTLHGEASSNHDVAWFEALFREIKHRFPALWLHSLSASEILEIARHSALPLRDTIARLRDAGLDSIPGSDAGILDDAVQPRSTRKCCTAESWLAVQRTAHGLGMQTTASILFGCGETLEHRLSHLDSIRQLQEETGGFTSFTPRSFTPPAAAVPGFEEATAVEYLKTLAISRMFLDTIANMECSLDTQGLKVLQVSLRFGANDAGSILLAKGALAATEEQVRHVIRDAGFRPNQRDTLYRTMFLG